MFFDDRLATVLRQRGDSEVGARTQFRQLLDILGNRRFAPRDNRSHSLIAAAWLRMDLLADRIPVQQRAAMIREPGWRLRTADLTAHLAELEPEVASAALNRAELSADDWSALIPRLPVRARGFLRLRKDLPVDVEILLGRLGVFDQGLPAPSAGFPGSYPDTIEESPIPASPALPQRIADTLATAPENEREDSGSRAQARPVDPEEPGRSEISALVERIAQFRRTRDIEAVDAELSPRLPLDETSSLPDRRITNFGFAADAAGRIEWAETEVAAMVVGTRLLPPRTFGTNDAMSELERAFSRHQPIERGQIDLLGAPAVAGEWIVDAQPRFTDAGAFTGYVGRFRRVFRLDGDTASDAARESDQIRQLLHELRTPVTAVQGYAEVIQQQLFGPAPHEYRALAAAIAADAAHILAGFEELDRLAKLESGAIAVERGTADVATLVTQIVGQLTPVLSPRMAGIELVLDGSQPLLVGMDADEAEAMIWRIMATLGGGCASGEMLACSLGNGNQEARLICELPAQLVGEEDMFATEARPVANSVNAGPFGAGFTLRLARAEARGIGGNLEQLGGRVMLRLPLLTAEDTLPSHGSESEAG